MKSPFLALCGLITLGAVHAVQDPTCVDCEAPLLANSNWGNGVLASGNYYAPSKTGNWALGSTNGAMGQLELRGSSATGYNVWHFCPAGTSGYCRIYMNQVITIKAGVTYDFSFEYSISSVRNQANTIEMYVETLPAKSRLFNQYTAAGNTAWTTFKAGPWTATISGDVLFTMTWYANSPVLGYSTKRPHLQLAVLSMLTGRPPPPTQAQRPQQRRIHAQKGGHGGGRVPQPGLHQVLHRRARAARPDDHHHHLAGSRPDGNFLGRSHHYGH